MTDSLDMPGGSFGANLQALRRLRGLTREDLSALAGIDVATVHRLERGERQPRLPTLLQLAAALGVSGSTLIEGIERRADR
jgi:transcriptional regulator with XRE-family HTH domain